MTDTAKRVRPAGKVWWGRLDEAEEGRRLLANPKFRKLMEGARHGAPGLTLDESNRRAAITEDEWAAADVEIDRLLAEQETAGPEAAAAQEGR